MNDFNPNTRLEKNADMFEIPVSKLSNFIRILTVPTGETLRGLDLSHWNADSKIDFPTLKANGIDFVILKVTEGVSFVDDTFKTKYTAALAADVIVMPYHFFRGNYGGTAQAKHCIDTLKALGFVDAIEYVTIIWGDVETTDGVSVGTRRNRLHIFLQEIEVKGFQGGVYSSPSYWNTLIGSVTWIADFWQWVAHWTRAIYPTLPLNWTKEKTLWWQNGIHPAHSWVETVIGATGNVDHNYFFGTSEDLKTILKFPTITPPGDCNCQEEISRLEAEINSNKLEIYNLQVKDLEIESDIDEAFDLIDSSTVDIYELKQRDIEIQSDLFNLELKVGILEDSFKALNEEVYNLLLLINAVDDRILVLEDIVNDLVTLTEMLADDLESVEDGLTKLGDLFENLKLRIDNIAGRVIDIETLEEGVRVAYNK